MPEQQRTLDAVSGKVSITKQKKQSKNICSENKRKDIVFELAKVNVKLLGGRTMRLYTKSGDKGKTSLIGGRVEKDNIRVEAYGTIDEANSFIGKAVAELKEQEKLFADIIQDLEKIQHELFDCGTELSNVTEKRPYTLTEEPIEYMEKRIDEMIDEAPKLERFILPGGAQAAATLHLARTVTRRAERQIVSLM